MTRTRKTIPPYIRNLVPSVVKHGMFDIKWDAVTYTMSLSLAQQLANYFKDLQNKEISVLHWYQQLSKEEQKSIIITADV